jgi:hypothetical protein
MTRCAGKSSSFGFDELFWPLSRTRLLRRILQIHFIHCLLEGFIDGAQIRSGEASTVDSRQNHYIRRSPHVLPLVVPYFALLAGGGVAARRSLFSLPSKGSSSLLSWGLKSESEFVQSASKMRSPPSATIPTNSKSSEVGDGHESLGRRSPSGHGTSEVGRSWGYC